MSDKITFRVLEDGTGSWSVFAVAASTARAATVTGLANGTSYVFRVSALNSQGAGAAAAPASALTPTP